MEWRYDEQMGWTCPDPANPDRMISCDGPTCLPTSRLDRDLEELCRYLTELAESETADEGALPTVDGVQATNVRKSDSFRAAADPSETNSRRASRQAEIAELQNVADEPAIACAPASRGEALERSAAGELHSLAHTSLSGKSGSGDEPGASTKLKSKEQAGDCLAGAAGRGSFNAVVTANCPRPYLHFQAHRKVLKLTGIMKSLSAQSRWLVPGSTSWNAVGTGSIISNRVIIPNKQLSIKDNETIRSRFPSYFTLQPSSLTSLEVNPVSPGKLPRWKDKGHPSKATRETNATLLAIRIGALVAQGTPRIEDVFGFLDRSEVGLLSMQLPAALESIFKHRTAANDLLARKLMRRLKHCSAAASGVFAWREGSEGRITLFGALLSPACGDAATYSLARAGTRFGRGLAKAGVPDENFYRISPNTFADLYDSSLDSFVDGWTDRNSGAFLANHPDAVDPIEFDFAAKRFRSANEIDAMRYRNEAMWNDYVARCGLPEWLGEDFLNVWTECLVRSPDDVSRYRHARDVIKRSNVQPAEKDAAKRAMAEIERSEGPVLATLSFYRGSPAEFAALATQSGNILGMYCPSELLDAGRELYESLRAHPALHACSSSCDAEV
ncbi:hypothetical protein [Lysobacter sp. HA35]